MALDFFRKLFTPPGTSQIKIPAIGLGSGRRLRSALSSADCIANLEVILRSCRSDKQKLSVSEESAYWMPFVVPGWQWNGLQKTPPETVISFQDSNNEVLFALFRSDSGNIEIGLFPLGAGDERLAVLPIIGHMKQRDASLASTGVIPANQLIVTPPHVPNNYVEEILSTAGFPITPP